MLLLGEHIFLFSAPHILFRTFFLSRNTMFKKVHAQLNIQLKNLYAQHVSSKKNYVPSMQLHRPSILINIERSLTMVHMVVVSLKVIGSAHM